MLVFLALGDAEVLSFALGDAKVPNARYFAFWWNIGYSFRIFYFWPSKFQYNPHVNPHPMICHLISLAICKTSKKQAIDKIFSATIYINVQLLWNSKEQKRTICHMVQRQDIIKTSKVIALE